MSKSKNNTPKELTTRRVISVLKRAGFERSQDDRGMIRGLVFSTTGFEVEPDGHFAKFRGRYRRIGIRSIMVSHCFSRGSYHEQTEDQFIKDYLRALESAGYHCERLPASIKVKLPTEATNAPE